MLTTTFVLAVTKTATLAFGALLTALSWRAYRRTDAPALRALGSGIGLVTVGALLGGAFHQFLDVPLAVGVSVQSIFTAAGFAVLTYSLYADGATEAQPNAGDGVGS